MPEEEEEEEDEEEEEEQDEEKEEKEEKEQDVSCRLVATIWHRYRPSSMWEPKNDRKCRRLQPRGNSLFERGEARKKLFSIIKSSTH